MARNDPVWPKLRGAIGAGYEGTKSIRDEHKSLMEIFYGGTSEVESLYPYNVVHRGIVSFLAVLAGNEATVEVDPVDDPDLEGLSVVLERYLTDDLRRTRFQSISERVLLDALCGFGTYVVGIAPSDNMVDIGGQWHDFGKRYCDRILPCDVLMDTSARSWDERQFHGHLYRSRVSDLMETGLFDEDALGNLPRSKKRDSDEGGADRSELFDLPDYVDLMDVWCAPGVVGREAVIVTMPGDVRYSGLKQVSPGKPVRVVEWTGPAEGPYVMDAFHLKSDSIVPAPPVRFWKKLAYMLNAVLAHIVDSDSRYKNGWAVDESVDDAKIQAWMNSPNEFVMKLQNPQLLQRMTQGGASPGAWNSARAYQELFSRISLNSDLLSGIGLGSDPTATEVTEVSSRLSAIVAYMQEKHYSACDRVLEQWFFWLRDDPMLNETVYVDLEGFRIPATITAEMFRTLDAGGKMAFKVRRGSMKRTTTEQEIMETMQLLGVVLPTATNVEKANPMFNSRNFITDMLNKKFDPAMVKRWWRDDMGMMQQQMMMMQGEPGMNGGGKGKASEPMVPGNPSPVAPSKMGAV